MENDGPLPKKRMKIVLSKATLKQLKSTDLAEARGGSRTGIACSGGGCTGRSICFSCGLFISF
jgi:hypothetical protein